jgi:hypothetical protein
MAPSASDDRGACSILALARLKPGITAERAQADMEVIARRIAEFHSETNQGWTVMVSSANIACRPVGNYGNGQAGGASHRF